MKIYEFGSLDNHAAIIVQQALEGRKVNITEADSKALSRACCA